MPAARATSRRLTLAKVRSAWSSSARSSKACRVRSLRCARVSTGSVTASSLGIGSRARPGRAVIAVTRLRIDR